MARFETFDDQAPAATDYEQELEEAILDVDLTSQSSIKWKPVEAVLASVFGEAFSSIHALGMGASNKLRNRIAQALKHRPDLMLFVANEGVYRQSLEKIIKDIAFERDLGIVLLADSTGSRRRVYDVIVRSDDDLSGLDVVLAQFPAATVTVASPDDAAGELQRTWRRSMSSGQSWFVQWWSGSQYDNEIGQRYAIGPDVGNRHQVSVGDLVFCYRSGEAAGAGQDLFGIARIGHRVDRPAKTKSGSPSLETLLYFDRYTPIEPGIEIDDVHDPRSNKQNSIQAVDDSWVTWALAAAGLQERDLKPVEPQRRPGELLSGRVAQRPAVRVDVLTLEDVTEAADEAGLYLPPSVVSSAVAALRSGKHLLLSGPPGTGKTSLAAILSEVAAEKGISRGAPVLTTATADWSVADTIGAYRLQKNQELQFTRGLVLDAIESDSWIVIDELNRSDIDKAIGQLFTVLAGQSVLLPFEEERDGIACNVSIRPQGGATIPATHEYEISGNWRIIATLNDHDKDLLFEMSEAMLRRFAHVPVGYPGDDEWAKILALQPELGVEPLDNAIRLLTTLPRPLGPAIVLDCKRFMQQQLLVVGESLDPVAAIEATYHAYVEPQLSFLAEDEREAIRAELFAIEDAVE